MNKYIYLIGIILIMLPVLITSSTSNVEAKTLRQAYADLEKLKDNAENTANKKKLTEQEMITTRNNISVLYKEIKDIDVEVVTLEQEIRQLNDDVKTKNEEIKELAKYLQVSNGEPAYLEYAFGSETLTEFVYRVAVVQQLNDYNSTLIAQMKQNIEDNKQKTIELGVKQKQLDVKTGQYVANLESLGEAHAELEEAYSDIKTDIAEAKALLAYYEEVGCKMDEDLSKCASKLAYNVAVKRPLSRGKITSGFGPRYVEGCSSCSTNHYGIDVGTPLGTPLYPVANGIVTSISRSSCGGLMITIIYNIKGKYYTSVYMHLTSTAVKVGQVVSVNQTIAYSGGKANAGDRCTTGPHLHFTMTTKARYVSGGLYGIPSSQVYSSYDAYKSNSFNQRSMFGFGSVGSYFSSRNV